MELFSGLKEGVWIIKWIDRFHFAHGAAESALVDVSLQRITADDDSLIFNLTSREIAHLLGRPNIEISGCTASKGFVTYQIFAGYLAGVRLGDIVVSKPGSVRFERCLQTEQRRVAIGEDIQSLRVRDTTTPYFEGWDKAFPFRPLNSFEYHLPPLEKDTLGPLMSKCLLFENRGTQYILPRIIIFRAFYGLSRELIDALLDGPWHQSSKRLISTGNYDSGISTCIDEETNTWKIVTFSGGERLARVLALLWFDPYAKKQVENLFVDALAQNRPEQTLPDREWMANAHIPHPLGPKPLQMLVAGFPLRPFFTKDQPSRFLITEIVSCRWPLPDQKIEWISHRSPDKGEKQVPATREDGYFRRAPLPVEADPDAIGTSAADPNADTPLNVHTAIGFEYLDAPPLQRQRKLSSKVFPPAPPPRKEGPAPIVSTGDDAYAKDAPAKCTIDPNVPGSSPQFTLVLQALERLKQDGKIHSFVTITPTADGNYSTQRDGFTCWNLLDEKDRRNRTVPKRAWEVVYNKHHDYGDANQSWPRAVIIFDITFEDKHVMLWEIEPRKSKHSFKMLLMQHEGKPSQGSILQALGNIRRRKGHFPDTIIRDADFCHLTTNMAQARRHIYVHTEPGDGETGNITALDTEALFKRISEACDPAFEDAPFVEPMFSSEASTEP